MYTWMFDRNVALMCILFFEKISLTVIWKMNLLETNSLKFCWSGYVYFNFNFET